MKLDASHSCRIQISSKWIKNINVRLGPLKVLEGRVESVHQDMDSGNKWDFTTPKNFFITKETVSQLKRQPTELEGEIFASYTSDRGLGGVSGIHTYTHHPHTHTQKQIKHQENQQPKFKKWALELNREFSKEQIQMAKIYIYRYPPSLAIREM